MNFLRTQRHQPVETLPEALDRFARQPGDQIRMDMHAGLPTQEAQIIFEPRVILSPLNQRARLLVEALDANLELQRAGGELRDDFAQRFWQTVRHHLEVEEHAGLMAVQKELEQRAAHQQVQVEGAVHELELLHPPVDESLQFGQHFLQGKLPHRNVQRRQAELAGERAAA